MTGFDLILRVFRKMRLVHIPFFIYTSFWLYFEFFIFLFENEFGKNVSKSIKSKKKLC